ncbi:hypothetical protein DAMA08_037610 [Martiniozyma asiatica (nom. inval.)]|nr:hypothetical protein DAMA08_037610 [Martiniozyma asiatica]
MHRYFTTVHHPSVTSLKPLPVALRHRISSLHKKLLQSRVAILQRIIPKKVAILPEQLVYCAHYDPNVKVPIDILLLKNKIPSKDTIPQSQLLDEGYTMLKERLFLKFPNMPTNSFLSPTILSLFIDQFNHLLDTGRLNYKGGSLSILNIYTRFAPSTNYDPYNAPKLGEMYIGHHELKGLPKLVFPYKNHLKTVKLNQTRNKILPLLIGIMKYSHAEFLNEFIDNFVILGGLASGSHKGLVEIVRERSKGL